MKLNIELAKLVDIVDIACRFVSKNSTLPILQNIYLKASIDSLTVRATDMEKYVEMELPCNIMMEGAITVNAKMFLDVLKSIEEEKVELSVQGEQLQIKTLGDDFKINGISAGEYVALPDAPQWNDFTLDTQNFITGIDKVEYTVTEKNFSPMLTWILMKTKTEDTWKKIVFVGTDSFRIAEYKINSNLEEDFTVLVPKVAVNDINSIARYALEHEVPTISVKCSQNLIAFEFQVDTMKVIATSLLIQGNFPDYEREEIMPTTFNHTILVDKEACDKAIKKIGILTKTANNFIQIETQSDKIIVSSGKTDKGNGQTEINAIVEWEPIVFAVNGKYITDFIRAMTLSDELQFNIVDQQKPMILVDKKDEMYRYVVRPLIIN